MRRALLLDDEPNVLHALERTLRQSFSQTELWTESYSDPQQALLRIGEADFDVVVSDYRMPAINGIDFLKAVKAIQPDSVRLMVSASTEFETAIKAINHAEIFRFIAKPWSIEEVKQAFLRAFQQRDQSLEERRLAEEMRFKLGELTPQEIEMRRLEEQEPGITKVKWGLDGSVHLDTDDET